MLIWVQANAPSLFWRNYSFSRFCARFFGCWVFFKTVRSLQLFLVPCPVNDRSLFAINGTRYLSTDFSLIVPRQHSERFLAETRGTRGWLLAARAPGGSGAGSGAGTAPGARGGRGSPRRLRPASLPTAAAFALSSSGESGG